MSDRVRERWAADQVALNAWSTFSSPVAAGLLARAGFDAVTVDLQHGEASIATVGELIAAIADAGAVPFVRLAWNDPAEVMRVLDLGARGLICPMVSSAEEASAFVRSCRYPPEGVRSYGPVRGAFGVGREQTSAANAAVLALAQIETEQGWAAVEGICATPGLDGTYVGPADLSLALGLSTFADPSDPALLDALDRIVRAAAASGIVAGVHAPSLGGTLTMAGRGFRFIGSTGDAELLSAGSASTIERLRADLASPGGGPEA